MHLTKIHNKRQTRKQRGRNVVGYGQMNINKNIHKNVCAINRHKIAVENEISGAILLLY